MIRIKTLASIVVVSLFSVASMAQTTEVNDFAYTTAVHAKTFNYDYRSVETADGKRVLLESAPNSGVEIGIHVGADYFNDVFTPTAGAEVGYHGRRFSFAGGASFGKGEYNDHSDKAGSSYLVTNFYADGGVRMFDLPSKYLHQKEVWLIGSFGYKVRKNYNQFIEDGELMEGDVNFKVKGSTMTYGLGIKVDFKNYMKKSNWYIKAMAYTGQEYFLEGSEARFGASLTIGFNFVVSGRHTVNHQAINKMFDSYEQYREAVRNAR